MLICILTKNVITSCSVTMMLFLHLEVKPLMTLTTALYLSCALISGHLAMMLVELVVVGAVVGVTTAVGGFGSGVGVTMTVSWAAAADAKATAAKRASAGRRRSERVMRDLPERDRQTTRPVGKFLWR